MTTFEKDHFDNRNIEKKIVHNKKCDFHVYEREIWYVKLGINVGFEENGKKEFRRPVLIIKKIRNMFYCVPLTTKGKENNKFYYKLSEKTFLKPSYLIVSQSRTLDKKRFMEYLGKVSHEEFDDIKKLLKEIYL